MPTPRPTSAASSGANDGTVTPWLSTSRTPNEAATATIAVTIGSSMAITEPNASSRMSTAARIPSASLLPNAGFSTFYTGAPPTATVSPACGARCERAEHRRDSRQPGHPGERGGDPLPRGGSGDRPRGLEHDLRDVAG